MEPDKIWAGRHVLTHGHSEGTFFLRGGELNAVVFAPTLQRPVMFAADGGVKIGAALGTHWKMPVHLRRGRGGEQRQEQARE